MKLRILGSILLSGMMVTGMAACSQNAAVEIAETSVEQTTAVETTVTETSVVETTVAETVPFERPACNTASLSCEVGDTVEYGSYYMNDDEMAPLTWICMDEKDGMVLLLSSQVIDCKMYGNKHGDTSWAECDLREWLNSEFVATAFSEDEASCIWYSDIVNDDNNTGLVEGGADTIDQVFILSQEELNRFFADDNARLCLPTDYAVAQGCWTSDFQTSLGCTSYWVRNPGLAKSRAVYVFLNGAIITDGDFVNQTFIGVRPAMWVKIA
ncbi:MAG: DUF6273 domain-containing protein [Saccharofermentans sp.]|nr:DUF6273 domain-containing protein [Saccharofermentans sp.]